VSRILHHYRDITASAVYMTTCDNEESFSFNMTVEITCHIRFLIYM